MKRKNRQPDPGGGRLPQPLVECCALSIVVYCEPGPDNSAIEIHATNVVKTRSPWGGGGGLGYLTLREPDFGRLWDGVDRGDAYGTAWAVLGLLGPGAAQFIGRVEDFVFGWTGGPDEEYGNVLLLQVIPRPHMLSLMN